MCQKQEMFNLKGKAQTLEQFSIYNSKVMQILQKS